MAGVVVVGVDGRCGRSEERLGAVHRGQHDGHIAAVVARSGVKLLVALIVLLVDDYQSEIGEG